MKLEGFLKKGWVKIFMKNEKIRASWDKLTPDSGAKQRMLSAIMSKYESENVTVYSRRSERLNLFRGYSPRIAAVAACLALVIGVGSAVYCSDVNEKGLSEVIESGLEDAKDSFVLTANAQELDYGAQVVFSELSGSGRGICGLPDGRIEMTSYTALPIRCEGENIDTITYTLKNSKVENVEAFLVLGKNYLERTENDSESYGDMPSFGRSSHAVGTYTVAYEDQPYFGENCMALDGEAQSEDEPVVLVMYYRADPELFGYESAKQFNEVRLMHAGDPYGWFEWCDIMADVYESEREKVAIKVTVTYNDGITQTETIDLTCKAVREDYDNGQFYEYMGVFGELTAKATSDAPVL